MSSRQRRSCIRAKHPFHVWPGGFSFARIVLVPHGGVFSQKCVSSVSAVCQQCVSGVSMPSSLTRRYSAAFLWLRTEELRTQKLKSLLLRTQSLKVLLLKPGVGQYKAIHATLTARDFFLAYVYPSSPVTCIFSKTSPNFFRVDLQNKIGHPAGCRFPC